MSTIINRACNRASVTPKNTGGKKQCSEGAVKSYALTKEDFSFANEVAVNSQTAMDAAITSKDVVIFYDIEVLELNNTEATIKTGRFEDFKTAEGIQGNTYTQYLSVCSYEALKSYEGSDYTRILRFTDAGEVLCETQTDGTIKGQPLKSFLVGIREDAGVDDRPKAKLTLKYKNHTMSVLHPDYDVNALEGIYDLDFEQVGTSTSTLIKFTAKTCNGNAVNSLTLADIVLVNGSGAVQTPTSLTANPTTGEYSLVGTAFAAGFKLYTDGVVAQSVKRYETPTMLVIA